MIVDSEAGEIVRYRIVDDVVELISQQTLQEISARFLPYLFFLLLQYVFRDLSRGIIDDNNNCNNNDLSICKLEHGLVELAGFQ